MEYWTHEDMFFPYAYLDMHIDICIHIPVKEVYTINGGLDSQMHVFSFNLLQFHYVHVTQESYGITHRSERDVKLAIAGDNVPAKSWLLRRLEKQIRQHNDK